MEDNRFKTYKNCEFVSVYKRLPDSRNEYLIRLRVRENKDDLFGDLKEVIISSSKLLEGLNKVKNKEINRAYFSYMMADIDVYFYDKHYIIENSPTDASYISYYLTKKDFDNLINCL